MDITKNPLGTEPIAKLIKKFAIPSIISMLVVSLYNLVDQFFIGQTVGKLGNAATNVAFPLTTLCIAIALAFGIGGASGFNLNMGAGHKEKAMYFIGNAITMMFSLGLIVSVVSEILLDPILVFFGAPAKVLPFAQDYVRIIVIGQPFVIMSAGGAHLIRADGSPKYSMYCNISGAAINFVLDYIFVMVLGWGMKGAALATILAQFVGFGIVVNYMRNFKTAKLLLHYLKPRVSIVLRTIHLGMAQCFNQLAMMIVQIVLNKSLTYYGGMSQYGSDVALACSGIIMKVNMIYFSIIIGISQGMQPIASFNRGARKFNRVKKAYTTALKVNFVISIIAFVVFQLFPSEIISIFGKENKMYMLYAENFFRIFLFMTFINGVQPLTSTFSTAIGEPVKGTFLSLTRQIIFFLPLIVAMPVIFMNMGKQGIDGIMYAAPIADFLSAVVSVIIINMIFKKFKKLELVDYNKAI